MLLRNLFLALTAITFIGCAETKVEESATSTDGNESVAVGDSPAENTDASTIDLTGENTTITFVGSHIVETPPDPEARTGSFKTLTGTAAVADGKLSEITLEIDVASLDTGNEKLDNHLKSPDFFDVRENPKATFATTAIEPGENGTVTITGDLSMLKETKSITFTGTMNTEAGIELKSEFEIDRTEFGMNYGTDKLEKIVQMSISVMAK